MRSVWVINQSFHTKFETNCNLNEHKRTKVLNNSLIIGEKSLPDHF